MALIKDNDGDIININKDNINIIKKITKYRNELGSHYKFTIVFKDKNETTFCFYRHKYTNETKCLNVITKFRDTIIQILLDDYNVVKVIEPCNEINLKK